MYWFLPFQALLSRRRPSARIQETPAPNVSSVLRHKICLRWANIVSRSWSSLPIYGTAIPYPGKHPLYEIENAICRRNSPVADGIFSIIINIQFFCEIASDLWFSMLSDPPLWRQFRASCPSSSGWHTLSFSRAWKTWNSQSFGYIPRFDVYRYHELQGKDHIAYIL